MRKVLFTLHPLYIQRNNWQHIATLRRNLELARKEAWYPEVKRRPAVRVLNPTVDQALAVLRVGDTRPFTFDIETVRATGEILIVGVSREPGHVTVIPWRQPFITQFKAAWEDPASEKRGHNSEAFDIPRVDNALNNGVTCKGKRFDTILAHALCWPDHEHGLDDLALDYSDKLPWKGDHTKSLEYYCGTDVLVTDECVTGLKRELRELGLEGMMERQMRAAPVINELCSHGVRVNTERQAEVKEYLERKQRALTVKMDKGVLHITGRVRQARALDHAANSLEQVALARWVPGKKREMGKLKTIAKKLRKESFALLHVNWKSHKQKKELLYGWCEAPEQKNEGRLTCDADAVVEIRRRAQDPGMKLPYRSALQAITSVLNEWNEYATVIDTFTNYTDEVLYPDLRLFGTGTGRLACRNPNLQNLPKRKPYSWMVRSMFEPVRKGNVFSARDYSQIEARLQAHKSQDPTMMEAFARGEDIHKHTAAVCLTKARRASVRPEDVTSQERLVHKRAVYLESYGGGWLKLQRALAAEGVYITPQEAKDTLRTLRTARPVLTAYREALLERVAQTRMLRNSFGRIRWFLGPAYGEVLNFPFQSDVADIMLDAMVRMRNALPDGANIVLQIHDELVVEHPPHLTDEVQRVTADVMEAPIPELDGWHCPTDGKTGPNLAFKDY